MPTANIKFCALFAICAIACGALCAQDTDSIRKLIVDGSAAGGKPNVYVNLFGKVTRVQLVGADDKGVTVSVMDNSMPLAWKDIAPEHLGPIAGEFAKSGDDFLLLVRFYADNNLPALAEKTALAAADKDKSLASEVGKILNNIKKPDPPPGLVSADPKAQHTAVSAGFPTSSSSSGGSRQNQDGRALPPLPDVKAPIMFDTPEADAVCSAMQIFPKNSAWNEDISALPVHPDSDKIVAFIGANKNLHTDYGANFIIVPPDQAKVDVKAILYPKESDKGPFPIPDNAPIEGWPAWWEKKVSLDEMQRVGDGDRHCSIVDPVNGMLYEFYQMRKTPAGWVCGCCATWDLKINKLRTKNWTSADAAGLPLFPGYIRYDDIQRGIVEHAMRMTVEVTRKAFVYPATHIAGATDNPFAPAMGQRLRLKANVDISKLPKEAQAVARGLKKYGAIIADNGGDWDFGFTIDKRFNDAAVKALRTLKGSDMEVVQNTGEHDPPRQ